MNNTDMQKKEKDKRQERGERLLEKCKEILQKEKIPVCEKIKALKINDRIRSRFGSCRKVQSGQRDTEEYLIEVSGRLMESEDKTIETVLLHELLHTCYGCMNHGKRW